MSSFFECKVAQWGGQHRVPPYMENPENLEFCHFLFQTWKIPGICSKSGKTWNFNSKPGKNLKFANSMFQASLFKMSFTQIILIYFFVICTLSTQTLIQSQIDLGFRYFYLEITNKIHGSLCHKISGNAASVLTHFEILITKICIKVPGIWCKKLEKTWNLGPKTLRKPGIWCLEKRGKPATECQSLYRNISDHANNV